MLQQDTVEGHELHAVLPLGLPWGDVVDRLPGGLTDERLDELHGIYRQATADHIGNQSGELPWFPSVFVQPGGPAKPSSLRKGRSTPTSSRASASRVGRA